ncbi:MAG: cytidylate kinase-like family protein [Duncaniella sp.]|nr:cytidylate kinase-like family protein [Duncaniella sp.]
MSESSPKKPFVITVGRQFGSGGRELGRELADRLGIAYYDKELLAEASKNSGIHHSFFEQNDEKFPSFLQGLFSFNLGHTPQYYYTGPSAITDDGLYKAISDFLLDRAEKESFVVVGRTADYILRDHPRTVNLFIHAPVEECVRRIRTRQPELSPEKATSLARKTNKLRSDYYNFFTDKEWGHASSYDLTFDSSRLPIKEIAGVVETYLRGRKLID